MTLRQISGAGDLGARLALLTRNGFARDTLNNTLGLLVAAALPIAIIPILARLYSPTDFGVFGVLSAWVGLATIAATGRYEAAILLPSDDREAVETASVALLFSLSFAALLLLLTTVLWGSGLIIPREFVGLAYLGAGTTLLAAFVQVLLNGAIRRKTFRLMSIARVAGAVASATTTLGLGALGFGTWGLALGVAAGFVAIIAVLSTMLVRHYAQEIRSITLAGIKRQARRYSNFLVFSLPSDFANTLASSLPVLFFSTFFGASATGYFAMFLRIWAGSNILVQGVGETFRQRAAAEYQTSGNFQRSMKMTLLPLASMAAVLLLALMLLAPTLFALVLGEHWREAGVYGQILAPLVCVQFVASPISWSFYIVEKLRLLMAWQLSLLVSFALVLGVGTTWLDERQALAAYCAVGTLLYLIYAWLSFKLAQGGFESGANDRAMRATLTSQDS